MANTYTFPLVWGVSYNISDNKTILITSTKFNHAFTDASEGFLFFILYLKLKDKTRNQTPSPFPSTTYWTEHKCLHEELVIFLNLFVKTQFFSIYAHTIVSLVQLEDYLGWKMYINCHIRVYELYTLMLFLECKCDDATKPALKILLFKWGEVNVLKVNQNKCHKHAFATATHWFTFIN